MPPAGNESPPGVDTGSEYWRIGNGPRLGRNYDHSAAVASASLSDPRDPAAIQSLCALARKSVGRPFLDRSGESGGTVGQNARETVRSNSGGSTACWVAHAGYQSGAVRRGISSQPQHRSLPVAERIR